MAYELKIIKDKELANFIFTQGAFTGDANSKNYTQKNFDKSWPTYLVFMVLYDGENPIAFSGAKDYGKFARIFDRWFVFPKYRQAGLGDNVWCKHFINPLLEHIGNKIPFISMEFARRKPALEKAVKEWNKVLTPENQLHVIDGLYETVPNSWQNIALPCKYNTIDLPKQQDYYKLFTCEITDIPIPTDWKPFQRKFLPDDNPWKYMPNWLNHKIILSDEIRINFYTQKADFELPFHIDDGPKCALNYLIQGNEPIVFENYGPVHYKMGLMNVSKRHMVPAGKIDRILLRYSFMSKDFQSVSNKLSKAIGDRTSIKYKELNSLLLKNF